MKLNLFKKVFALMFSVFVLVGCESMDTQDESMETAGSDVSSSQEAATSGAPEEAQVSAEELAEQKAKEAAMKAEAALREIRTFYFDFDQSTVKSDSRAALSAHAAFLSANPAVKVLLEGHCDERGTKEYNIALGESRAKAVARFLKVNGVSDAQIETISYGEERPADAGHNEAAWTKNRRVFIEYK